MIVGILYALFASAAFYGVVSCLFWAPALFASAAFCGVVGCLFWAPALFASAAFYGVVSYLSLAPLNPEVKLRIESRSECRDFKPPPVQVIDDVEKKCD